MPTAIFLDVPTTSCGSTAHPYPRAPQGGCIPTEASIRRKRHCTPHHRDHAVWTAWFPYLCDYQLSNSHNGQCVYQGKPQTQNNSTFHINIPHHKIPIRGVNRTRGMNRTRGRGNLAAATAAPTHKHVAGRTERRDTPNMPLWQYDRPRDTGKSTPSTCAHITLTVRKISDADHRNQNRPPAVIFVSDLTDCPISPTKPGQVPNSNQFNITPSTHSTGMTGREELIGRET
jgi:hypothetical protein